MVVAVGKGLVKIGDVFLATAKGMLNGCLIFETEDSMMMVFVFFIEHLTFLTEQLKPLALMIKNMIFLAYIHSFKNI